jgi:hypothetical protein
LSFFMANGVNFTGDYQLDSPDSPMAEDVPHRTDPSILDDDAAAEEDVETSFAHARRGTAEDASSEQTNKGTIGPPSQRHIPREKQKTFSSTSAAGSSFSSCGNRPSLPPIYHTVRKLKKDKLVVRHLNGGGTSEMVCTTTGVTNSIAGGVGSFINDNDKRHNLTTHRHDHSHLRNISFSFNPETLVCNTCPGEHRILHRTVEGNDVRMNFPPPIHSNRSKLSRLLAVSLARQCQLLPDESAGLDTPAGLAGIGHIMH